MSCWIFFSTKKRLLFVFFKSAFSLVLKIQILWWILKISFLYGISSRSRICETNGISSLSKKTETEMGSTWKDGLKMLFLKTSRMLATNLSVPVLLVFMYFFISVFFPHFKRCKWGENVSHQSASLDLASVFLYFCFWKLKRCEIRRGCWPSICITRWEADSLKISTSLSFCTSC